MPKSILQQTSIRVLVVALLSYPKLSAGSGPEMTVHIADYSRLAPGEMASAQRAADSALGTANVRVNWRNCPIVIKSSKEIPACEPGTDASHFIVVLLPEQMARKIANHRQAGLAPLGSGSEYPSQAYVFTERLGNLVKEAQGQTAGLLGLAVAHELGHLLLGEGSHSPTGIMRAQWRSREMRDATMGVLGFTRAQSERIRTNLNQRLVAKSARD